MLPAGARLRKAQAGDAPIMSRATDSLRRRVSRPRAAPPVALRAARHRGSVAYASGGRRRARGGRRGSRGLRAHEASSDAPPPRRAVGAPGRPRRRGRDLHPDRTARARRGGRPDDRSLAPRRHSRRLRDALGLRHHPGGLLRPARPRLAPDPEEVHAAHIVPLALLDAPELPSIRPAEHGSGSLVCFPLAALDTTIWAPTAALLYQIREVVLHGRATRVAHFEQPRFAWE